MSSSDKTGSSPRSRHILTSTGWNIIGRIAPVFVAILVTPRLIHLLGLSRWGIFTIALSLISTLGIFDLGLGRALTRAIADRPEGKTTPETADLIFTGSAMMGLMGGLGGLVAAGLVGLWVDHGLKIAPELHSEVLWSLWIFCATGPLLMINAAFWGVFTGYNSFRTVNLITIPVSVAYYVAPVLVLYVWDSLIGVMLAIFACRLWLTFAYARSLLHLVPALKHARFRGYLLKPLLRIGGWMTVSNLAFPILNYVDRFMIASVVSAAATSFYTTPADVVTRFNMLSSSVSASSFPALASSWRREPERASEIYCTSVLAVSALLFPPCLITALFSHTFLSLWIDASFADHSAMIMRFLCVGVFLSGVDSIASGLLDAIGRPDVNARFSIGEIIFYLPVLYLSLIYFGVPGAACAWAVRICADYGVRSLVSLRFYAPLKPAILRVLPATVSGAVLLVAAMVGVSSAMAAGEMFLSLLIFYAVLWFVCLNHGEREAFLAFSGKIRKRIGINI
ncbi:MAG: oligosaccharide flippase family protein [Acetobacter sp.]|uniref:oligosaccharide flippase family protein n=1 Tax=Acetobacter sp. TaxID=440 RepID=UPI0039E7B99A